MKLLAHALLGGLVHGRIVKLHEKKVADELASEFRGLSGSAAGSAPPLCNVPV